MDTHIRTRDGTQLNVRVEGEGARTVVFVHGWMVSGNVFSELLTVLPKDGLRLVVPSLRGTGSSDHVDTGHDLATYADDIADVLDALSLERVTLVGHSMGGQIAQLVAARHPGRVDGVALLCPVPLSGIPFPAEVAELFSTSTGDRTKHTHILAAACKALPDATRDALLDDAARTNEAAITQGFEAFKNGAFPEEAAKIEAPVLVVATDDPFLPPEFLNAAIVANIPLAALAYLPGAGHYPANERPRETAAVLSSFFAGLRGHGPR